MSAIIPFQFEAHAVRVQVDELLAAVVYATDVCDALEMGNPSPGDHSRRPRISRNWRPIRRVAVSAPAMSTNRALRPDPRQHQGCRQALQTLDHQ